MVMGVGIRRRVCAGSGWAEPGLVNRGRLTRRLLLQPRFVQVRGFPIRVGGENGQSPGRAGDLFLGVGQPEVFAKQEAEGDPKIPLSKKWPTMLQWSSDEEGYDAGGDTCRISEGSLAVGSGGFRGLALGAGGSEGESRGLDTGAQEEGIEGEEELGVDYQSDISYSPGTPDLSWQGQLDFGEEDPGEQDAARGRWGEEKAGPWAASRIASSGGSKRRIGAADASNGRCGGEGVAPPVAAAQKEQRPGPSRRRSKQRGEYSSCVRCGGSGASVVEWEERSEESLEEGELRNSGSEYEWWESGGRGTSNPVRKSLQVQQVATRCGERRGQRKGGEARTVQERPPLLSPVTDSLDAVSRPVVSKLPLGARRCVSWMSVFFHLGVNAGPIAAAFGGESSPAQCDMSLSPIPQPQAETQPTSEVLSVGRW
ncbi:hypothetical protein NDU88_003691 [Pleurodeles waltl]|uniref:Uncharacterized protein n=1 Tax=Pleurodeles waltl TaxID=8319 RepID=A0AAV7TPS2_PLEWA|nr:hypothetical protein NDU88_003691 [Pleurodeles waltl]